MTLPAAIRPGEAKATYKGDRLEVRLPREKEARVRRLGVE
jgi:HSP20 family molecular chaperone IbpA